MDNFCGMFGRPLAKQTEGRRAEGWATVGSNKVVTRVRDTQLEEIDEFAFNDIEVVLDPGHYAIGNVNVMIRWYCGGKQEEILEVMVLDSLIRKDVLRRSCASFSRSMVPGIHP